MLQILVSACLAGENCKWDGGSNRNEAVLRFMEEMKGKAQFHLICPEQDGGLPTPRPASEIRFPEETVINTEGRDVTAEFLLGAVDFLGDCGWARSSGVTPKYRLFCTFGRML